jgi:hypothetical protein
METVVNDPLINPTAQQRSSAEPDHTCEQLVVFSSLQEIPDDDVALLAVDENLHVPHKYCWNQSRCCIAIVSISVAAILISGLVVGLMRNSSSSHAMSKSVSVSWLSIV